MLDGKDAYQYARRRLGFVTYWRCRIEDATREPKTLWRILDATAGGAVVGLSYSFGTWWLALLVFAFGMWNYIDGQVRARW